MQTVNKVLIDYPSILVSVVVPVYNSEKYLCECLDSVLSQNHSNFELICVDDGSTDASVDILRKYEGRDARIRVLVQENQGPGVARNVGLDASKGKYIYFLDSDDFIEPEMFARCITALEQSGDDIVAFAYNEYNMETNTTRRSPWSKFLSDLPACSGVWRDDPDHLFYIYQNVPWNKFFRNSFLKENNIRFQDIRLTEDLMFSASALIKANGISSIDKVLVTQRQGLNTNAMSNKDLHPTAFLMAFETLRDYLKEHGIYSELRVAYLNWACDGCMYNLLTLNSYEGFKTAYEALSDGGLARLGLIDAGPEVFYDSSRDLFMHFIEMVKKGSVNDYLMDLYVGTRNGCDIREIHIQNLVQDLAISNDRIDNLEHALAERDRTIGELKLKLSDAEGSLDYVCNSTTWKAGSVVTAIPRMLKDRLSSN